MTKFQWAIIGILTVDVIAVFGFLIFLIATSGTGLLIPARTNALVTATVAPFRAPPTSIPPTRIPSCDATEYMRRASPTFQKFYDALKLGVNTPRISLPQVISEMQSTRREFQNLQAPACASEFKRKATASMDAAIDAFMLFLGNAPETSVEQKMREANNLLEDALDELDRLRRTDSFQ